VSSLIGLCLPFAQSRRLHWAIEWVHGDGGSHISEIREDTPLARSYTPIFYKHNGESKKRKREGENSPNEVPKQKLDSLEHDIFHDGVHHEDITTAAMVASTELNSSDVPPTRAKAEDEKTEQLQLKPGTADELGNYFYLVKPHTSGTQKVLIPLSPTDGLQDCLRNQVILEFPTVQVLPYPPAALPSTFILEDDYLDKSKRERDEMQRLVAESEDPKVDKFKAELDKSAAQSIPNASDILATLERDISGSIS
jgi:hypothetical protein